jgi:hypothetical protein
MTLAQEALKALSESEYVQSDADCDTAVDRFSEMLAQIASRPATSFQEIAAKAQIMAALQKQEDGELCINSDADRLLASLLRDIERLSV